jgi:hypothetical protein
MRQPVTKLGGTVLKSIAPAVPKRHWLFCFWAKASMEKSVQKKKIKFCIKLR